MDKTIEIAGRNKIGDWISLRDKINNNLDNEALWKKAFTLFSDRMNHRYIYPAQTIEYNSSIIGEGFAISAILCSLIEALETFYQGLSYKRKPPRSEYEYFESKKIFIRFLISKPPFNKYFDDDLAKDFYENFRCPLLHEAATRKGWKIRIDEEELITKIGSGYIFNRILFIDAIKEYIKYYKKHLFLDNTLKKAFIRKMDFICNTA